MTEEKLINTVVLSYHAETKESQSLLFRIHSSVNTSITVEVDVEKGDKQQYGSFLQNPSECRHTKILPM